MEILESSANKLGKKELQLYKMLKIKLEFKDGSKPVKIQLTNLDVPVDMMYKLIVERVNY